MRLRAALIIAIAACGGGKSASIDAPPATADARLVGFDQPDEVCPGGPTCATTGDGTLYVGAGKHTFTPQVIETWTDQNGNFKYDPGEPYDDKNGNGKFDGTWLFGGGNAANGVKTDLEARALAFREGDVTVAIVYLDCTGFFAGDMDAIRADPKLAPLGIDHVIVGSTHAHLAVDTVGLWGADTFTSGYDDAYVATVRAAAVDAIADAVGSMKPAHLIIAKTLLLNDPKDSKSKTDRWDEDIRDPVIFDPTMTIARFVDAKDDKTTIGTLVNWADHPEVAVFDHSVYPLISAHYPHWLREYTEQGFKAGDFYDLTRDLPGWGGVTVFVQGALGGQIGSIRSTAIPDRQGNLITAESHAKDEALGANTARRALETLLDEGEIVGDLPLSYRSASFAARLDNTGLQVAVKIGLIKPNEHRLVGYDPNAGIDETNPPWLPLRATYLQIGPLGLVTAPGELHPELWVGGYDGSWSWGWPLMDTTKPNAPDLSKAPKGPYLRDLVLANPGVRYPVLAGLAEDYVGYIVPAYNYVLDPSNPYLTEAAGEHYEETYSLGPDIEAQAVHPILDLVSWRQK
jgi:hypothetical protein